MWNECTIWLQHHERMAQLRHEAYVARLRCQCRPLNRDTGILAALLRRVRLRAGTLFRLQPH